MRSVRCLAWEIRFSKEAVRSLRKLDKKIATAVRNELEEIGKLDDPRSRGKWLKHDLRGLWRYRVGDYRIVCDIVDEKIVVLVLDVEHRSAVYKSRKKRTRG